MKQLHFLRCTVALFLALGVCGNVQAVLYTITDLGREVKHDRPSEGG